MRAIEEISLCERLERIEKGSKPCVSRIAHRVCTGMEKQTPPH